MDDQKRIAAISRRKVLAGLAATAGAAALAGGAYGVSQLVKESVKPVTAPKLVSKYIGGPVPADDPDAGAWRKGEAQRVLLQGQNVIVPLKTDASVTDVTVRSVHDGETIGFLLEWDDPKPDEHTIKIDNFRDACGVFLGPAGAGPGLWTMGQPENPVTILHWKADWQKDIDAGFQDLEVAFPNVTADFYPPLVGVTNPKVPDDYPEEARNRLPGWYVGNPLSQPVKTTPVEKLRAIGPGTLEHLPTQNVKGRGVWKDGHWKVALTKPLAAADAEELELKPGQTYALAFSVWAGSATDRGSRKSITQLGELTVEAKG